MLQLTVLDDLSFSSIDVGQPGKANDAMVFKMSHLWVASGGRVDHLIAKPGFHILGDGAYPSKSYLLKPFRDDGDLTCRQQRYNFVHSSSRSMVEHGIGRLKGRFGCLHFLDARTPAKAKKIIATCCMHSNTMLAFCLTDAPVILDPVAPNRTFRRVPSTLPSTKQVHNHQNESGLASFRKSLRQRCH